MLISAATSRSLDNRVSSERGSGVVVPDSAAPNVLTHQVGSAAGHFQPISNEHVSTWTASVYTVHVIMFPRASACVCIVHVMKRSCFEFHVYTLWCEIMLYAFYLNELNENIRMFITTFCRENMIQIYIRRDTLKSKYVSLGNFNIISATDIVLGSEKDKWPLIRRKSRIW